MLVDYKFKQVDAVMKMLLSSIGGGGFVYPERLSKGLYITGHWNTRDFCNKDDIDDDFYVFGDDDFSSYGVCDSPQQLVEKYDLENRPEKYFVSFVKITKLSQPSTYGWRWHKWGPYVGNQEPKHEYLYDEKDIDEVYTFHIFKIKETKPIETCDKCGKEGKDTHTCPLAKEIHEEIRYCNCCDDCEEDCRGEI